MEEKLKSISKRIHWSLVLKAAIFAVAWFVLPFWLFLLVALYLYFVPFAGSASVALPFLVLLLVSGFESSNVGFALIFGIIFYYILLIRDLFIIDRKSAYEIVVLALSYLLLRVFFMKAGADFGGASLFYSFFVAGIFSMMLSNFIANFSDAFKDVRPFRRMINWISFILMWQLLIVGLFLPLDFVYQSAIVFLLSMILIDLLPSYIIGQLSRVKTLVTGSVIFILLTIIVSSARWSL
jgi:hypothetical protein